MFGIGKWISRYRLWRKVKPVVDVLGKKGAMSKLKSRKLWVVAGLALLGSVMTQIGMDPDQWANVSDWLMKLAGLYILGNVGEHVADAMKAKKK